MLSVTEKEDGVAVGQEACARGRMPYGSPAGWKERIKNEGYRVI
jgi:hypothetical protein